MSLFSIFTSLSQTLFWYLLIYSLQLSIIIRVLSSQFITPVCDLSIISITLLYFSLNCSALNPQQSISFLKTIFLKTSILLHSLCHRFIRKYKLQSIISSIDSTAFLRNSSNYFSIDYFIYVQYRSNSLAFIGIDNSYDFSRYFQKRSMNQQAWIMGVRKLSLRKLFFDWIVIASSLKIQSSLFFWGLPALFAGSLSLLFIVSAQGLTQGLSNQDYSNGCDNLYNNSDIDQYTMINTLKSFQILANKSLLQRKIQFYMAMHKFPLPDLGQKIKEGTVKKLYVKEGDQVDSFQKIADVESDKQFTEITSPEVGKIARLYYQESQVCKVGDLFMEIQTNQQEPVSVTETKKKEPEQPKSQSQSKFPQPKKHDVNWSEEVFASPVVRMFAYTEGVDLFKVKGSGKRGRILKEDVIAFKEGRQKPQKQQKQQVSNRLIGKRVIPENKTIKMNAYQKGMQKSMTESNKVPHLYLFESVDITETDKMRKALKNNNMRVTIMGILTKTLSLALNQVPIMNSTYEPDNHGEFEYKIHKNHNVSLAIDSPNGLVAPNIKNVQNLSLLQIQQELENLKNLAEKAQLTKKYLENGTICLSNIGTIGGVSACPLILCPETCIIAIGKVIQKPSYFAGSSTVFKKKQIVLGFGCDHRVLDGATVARFSNEWKKILENPYIGLAKMH